VGGSELSYLHNTFLRKTDKVVGSGISGNLVQVSFPVKQNKKQYRCTYDRSFIVGH